MSLDQFLPPSIVKTKQDTGIDIVERCSNPRCKKPLNATDPKFVLSIKGKEKPYCPTCAKAIFRAQENSMNDI